MSLMGLVCCMVVVAVTTKAMSSTVTAVMAKMPRKARHISVMAFGSATASTGPTEHSATRPKLSWAAFSSLRMEDTPTPRAIIKGTVIGPVVTPPLSKETGTKSAGAKNASRNMSG